MVFVDTPRGLTWCEAALTAHFDVNIANPQMAHIFKDPDRVQPYPQCPGNLEASLSISDTCRSPPATDISFDNPFLGNNTWCYIILSCVGNDQQCSGQQHYIPELHVGPIVFSHRVTRYICNIPITFHDQSIFRDLGDYKQPSSDYLVSDRLGVVLVDSSMLMLELRRIGQCVRSLVSHSASFAPFNLLKIAGPEHLDRYRLTEGKKQWMASAVDTQPN
jgi:hypothetical protein